MSLLLAKLWFFVLIALQIGDLLLELGNLRLQGDNLLLRLAQSRERLAYLNIAGRNDLLRRLRLLRKGGGCRKDKC